MLVSLIIRGEPEDHRLVHHSDRKTVTGLIRSRRDTAAGPPGDLFEAGPERRFRCKSELSLCSLNIQLPLRLTIRLCRIEDELSPEEATTTGHGKPLSRPPRTHEAFLWVATRNTVVRMIFMSNVMPQRSR